MKTNKILLGGIAGGVMFQLVAFLLFFVVFKDLIKGNYDPSVNNADWNFWGLENIISNLAWGLLLSYIFNSAKTTGVVNGLKSGAIVGLLVNVGIDLWLHAQTKIFTSCNAAMVDILINIVIFALTGAAVAWAISKVND